MGPSEMSPTTFRLPTLLVQYSVLVSITEDAARVALSTNWVCLEDRPVPRYSRNGLPAQAFWMCSPKATPRLPEFFRLLMMHFDQG